MPLLKNFQKKRQLCLLSGVSPDILHVRPLRMSSPALCSSPERALAKTWSSTRYSASRSEIKLWASHCQFRKSRRKKQLLHLSFCKNVSSLEIYIYMICIVYIGYIYDIYTIYIYYIYRSGYISTSSRRWWNIPKRRQGAKAQPRRLGNYSVFLGRKLIFPLASGLCTQGPSVNFLPIPAPLFQGSPRPVPLCPPQNRRYRLQSVLAEVTPELFRDYQTTIAHF